MFGLIKSNHAVEDTEGVLMQVMAPMEKYLSGVVRAEKFRHGEKEAAQRPPRRGAGAIASRACSKTAIASLLAVIHCGVISAIPAHTSGFGGEPDILEMPLTKLT